MRLTKTWITIAAWLLAALILLLVMLQTDTATFVENFRTLNPWWLIAAGLISVTTEIFPGSLRYQIILRSLDWHLPFREVVAMRMGAMPIRQATPFKAGEAARILWLRQRHNIPVTGSFLAFLINVAAQLFSISAIAAIGLIVINWRIGITMSLLIALLTWLGLHFSWLPGKLQSSLSTCLATNSRVLATLKDLSNRTDHHRFRKRIVGVLALSVLVTSLELASAYCVFLSFGLAFPGWIFFPVMAAVMLITTVPLTPFGLGVRSASLTALAAGWMDMSGIVASALMITAVSKVLPSLVGLFWLSGFVKGLLLPGKPIESPLNVQPDNTKQPQAHVQS